MIDRRHFLALAAAATAAACASTAPTPPSRPRAYLVFFEPDSAVLTPLARETLASVPAHLAENPQGRIVVEGHTDAIGSADYNLALGVRRAAAVRAFLTDAGIPAARIHDVSYGQAAADTLGEPRASALLRRVVVRVE